MNNKSKSPVASLLTRAAQRPRPPKPRTEVYKETDATGKTFYIQLKDTTQRLYRQPRGSVIVAHPNSHFHNSSNDHARELKTAEHNHFIEGTKKESLLLAAHDEQDAEAARAGLPAA